MRGAAFILILALWPATALAGLTEAQVGQVSLSPPPGARVPTALVFKDLDGRDVTLGDAIAGRPTLLLPADFTCTTDLRTGIVDRGRRAEPDRTSGRPRL